MVDIDEIYEIAPLLTLEDFNPKGGLTSDEEEAVSVFLMYLYQLYEEYNVSSPSQILNEFQEAVDKLIMELVGLTEDQIDNYILNDFRYELDEYGIPYDVLSYDSSDDKELIEESLIAALITLNNDITVKAMHYVKNMSNFMDSFNINGSFKQAITKINNLVAFNIMNAKEKSHREVLKFVYGDDELYYWDAVMDMRTCRWCIDMSKSEPMTIDKFPLDHPHGRCSLVPVNGDFSDRYKEVMR
ncbi:hypothetical protein [Methanobrevibacter sp. DSM 116169]|uniref:hypothetical protein n=1 Tax=Methanobrevibacter sp. DSM 116169 TaxID=3242727 RepID=UPI0038FC85B9